MGFSAEEQNETTARKKIVPNFELLRCDDLDLNFSPRGSVPDLHLGDYYGDQDCTPDEVDLSSDLANAIFDPVDDWGGEYLTCSSTHSSSEALNALLCTSPSPMLMMCCTFMRCLVTVNVCLFFELVVCFAAEIIEIPFAYLFLIFIFNTLLFTSYYSFFIMNSDCFVYAVNFGLCLAHGLLIFSSFDACYRVSVTSFQMT